jgi:hypothetical protein
MATPRERRQRHHGAGGDVIGSATGRTRGRFGGVWQPVRRCHCRSAMTVIGARQFVTFADCRIGGQRAARTLPVMGAGVLGELQWTGGEAVWTRSAQRWQDRLNSTPNTEA